jgi:DNA-binding response OmpR family regulator
VDVQRVNFKLLLVCDEPDARRLWAGAIGRPGLEVVPAGSAQEALGCWEQEVFDMVVIDLQPGRPGRLELCERLRAQAVNPILLLIPEADESHIIEAYRAGADECIVTPISARLLSSKVLAWLRRSWTISAGALTCLQVGDMHLDPGRRALSMACGAPVTLTGLELRLLHLLMSHPGQVFEPETIVERVWGPLGGGDRRVLDRLARQLQRKIEADPGQPCHLQVMDGDGYTFAMQ